MSCQVLKILLLQELLLFCNQYIVWSQLLDLALLKLKRVKKYFDLFAKLVIKPAQFTIKFLR